MMGTADGVEPGSVDRAALQLIAEGVTELAGFELAAISIVHDGRLHTIAIAGPEHADAELSTLQPRVAEVLAELEHAEDWGMFQFVPHESLDPESEMWGWVPELEPASGPDAWHPMDLLVAPLYGPNGELRGTLSIDCPTDGRRPDEAHRCILNRYAEQAARALYIAVEREAFADLESRTRQWNPGRRGLRHDPSMPPVLPGETS
jgi:hypothetical protein